MEEGSRHFEGASSVHAALQKITRRLNELHISYAVVGGMALFAHGYRRFTEDVDILVTRDGLKQIHEQLEGLGWKTPFAGSKNLRDTEFGVKIEFLITGAFPGDGKPKPVAFPDPNAIAVEIDGIRYINLPTIVELKIASGMTAEGRLGDLSDVIKLITALDLPRQFAESLSPYVREKFDELWRKARKRYVRVWRNKFLTTDAQSIEQMIQILRSAAAELERMKQDGVVLDVDGGTSDDYAYLMTTDPKVAEKYDMHDEEELWEDETEEDTDPQSGSPAT